MSKGVFEELAEAISRVERKVDALACGGSTKGVTVRVASLRDLAKRYSMAKSTLVEMLHRMEAAGFHVETSRVGVEWRVDVAQFDKAYDELCSEEFVKKL